MDTDSSSNLIEKFQDQLGYTFVNKSNILQAFTTISFSNENGEVPHNEPLATLGDAVAKLIITRHAIQSLKLKEKGEITKYKERFEKREVMTERLIEWFPDSMDNSSVIMKLIRMGKGERNSKQYLENNFFGELLEAIFGAVFLDSFSDLIRTETVVKRLLRIK